MVICGLHRNDQKWGLLSPLPQMRDKDTKELFRIKFLRGLVTSREKKMIDEIKAHDDLLH